MVLRTFRKGRHCNKDTDYPWFGATQTACCSFHLSWVDFHFVAGRPVEILVDFSVASFANIREVEMVSMQSAEFYGIERFTIVPEQLPVFTFSPLKILKLTLIGIKKRIILLEYQENIQEYMKIKETLAMFRDF